MDGCAACGRALTKDEKALTKKLVSRGAESFFCLSCLAEKFAVSEELLTEKIDQFRKIGCTLFE